METRPLDDIDLTKLQKCITPLEVAVQRVREIIRGGLSYAANYGNVCTFHIRFNHELAFELAHVAGVDLRVMTFDNHPFALDYLGTAGFTVVTTQESSNIVSGE